MWAHPVSALVLLAAIAGCSRPSQDSTRLTQSRGSPAEEQRPLPTDPNLSVGTLGNGVKYMLQPWPNTGHATRLALVVGAGSLAEGEGERGFAHFVEHAAMDPAQRFGELAPSELLARLGATLDADANAETHFSHTRYFMTLQGSDPELIAQGLTALAGWASQVQFTPDVVERQRSIVLAELRTSDGQKTNVPQRLNRFLTEGLGVAERGPLGAPADLQAAAGPRLEAFYRRWYLPQNLTVVATGEFDREAVSAQIQSHFGALSSAPEASPPARAEATRPAPAFLPGEASILGNAKEEPLPGGFATLILQLPTSGVRSEHDYRADLTDRYLCTLLEDRLHQPPQRGRFECSPARPGWGQAQLRLRAWATEGALRTSVEALLLELQRSLQHGFLPTELRSA
jgi:zinc protease